MKRSIVAGNWKMQGTRATAVSFVHALLNQIETCQVDVVFCPPLVYLDAVAQLLKGSSIAWGGQVVSAYEQGAYTGDCSAAMLRDLGCRYVILGHSERRQYHGETDKIIAEQFALCQRYDLIPMLCLGETLAQREAGESLSVVVNQLMAVVKQVTDFAWLKKAVLAYEPIWAIGTGQSPRPETVQLIHQGLRRRLAEEDHSMADAIRIIYGGSVNGKNAKGFLQQPDIDGVLVGGASLQIEEFCQIVKLAEQ